jgi:uncharacterized membrane protein YfcA
MAVGRILPPAYEPIGHPAPSFLLLVFGGAVGACLGLRWFWESKPVRCILATILISTVTTLSALLLYYIRFETVSWLNMVFASVFAVLGGALGGTLAGFIVAVRKTIHDERNKRRE